MERVAEVAGVAYVNDSKGTNTAASAPALAAFDDVVFRRLEFVMDEIEFGGAGEVADREDAAQGLFEAGDVIDLLVRAQELLVAFALNLDQVRHLHDFVNVSEDLADAALGRAGLGPGPNVLGARVVRALGRHRSRKPLLPCRADREDTPSAAQE